MHLLGMCTQAAAVALQCRCLRAFDEKTAPRAGFGFHEPVSIARFLPCSMEEVKKTPKKKKEPSVRAF